RLRKAHVPAQTAPAEVRRGRVRSVEPVADAPWSDGEITPWDLAAERTSCGTAYTDKHGTSRSRGPIGYGMSTCRAGTRALQLSANFRPFKCRLCFSNRLNSPNLTPAQISSSESPDDSVWSVPC